MGLGGGAAVSACKDLRGVEKAGKTGWVLEEELRAGLI